MWRVYLLHFSAPLRGRFQHYIGQTERDVEARVAEHRAGRGARITRQAVAAGIGLELARVWEGVPRSFERHLKKRGAARHFCPVCRGEEKSGVGCAPTA